MVDVMKLAYFERKKGLAAAADKCLTTKQPTIPCAQPNKRSLVIILFCSKLQHAVVFSSFRKYRSGEPVALNVSQARKTIEIVYSWERHIYDSFTIFFFLLFT